jgi:hypothetical protein
MTAMSWLINKLRDGRISLTIKELKYDLDSAARTRRATILFKAQLYRCQLMSRADIDIDVFRNPQAYPRSWVMELVGGMELLLQKVARGRWTTTRSLDLALPIL